MTFKIMVPTFVLMLITIPILSIAAEEHTYAISSKYSPIAVKMWTEEKSIHINETENSGLGSPVDALVTFFYFGKTNQIQYLLDMHYEPDGTRTYVKGLLERAPDAFLGARNLKSLTVKKITYWGNHRTEFFNMVNNDNKSANWAEDFVCESAQCLKSNLALFGDNDNTNLYSILSRSNSNPMTKQGATNGFSSYLFQPEYGPNSEYPITLFIDKKSITPAVNDTEWHKKLIQLKGILEVSDQDVAKIQSTNEFLVNNYRDWDTNQFTNPYFGTFSTEKDFMTVNLNRVSDFRIASFIENSDYVWIFAEAVNTSTAKGLFFLFVFNRQANKFEMDGVEKGESRKIDRVLRHEFIAQNIFNEDSQGNKSKPDEPNKNMRIAETVNSLSVPFLIFIVVIILSVVGFVAF